MEGIETGYFSGREIPLTSEHVNEAVKFWSYEQEMILYRNIAQVLDYVKIRKYPLKSSRIKKKHAKTPVLIALRISY